MSGLDYLIADYDAYLQVKKGRARGEPHRKRVRLCLERMLWGADSLSEITVAWVERRMTELLTLPGRRVGVTVSRNTIDTHRSILRTFFEWLRRKRELVPKNPVDGVDPFEREDSRGPARPFAAGELVAFWRAVPDRRRLIYATWAATGLRPAETRRLVWDDVILEPADGGPPYFLLRGAKTKNKRPDRLPIHPKLAEMLRAARGSLLGSDRVFRVVPRPRTFEADVRRAGLSSVRETAEGKLVRYSLRKTFVTDLVSDERSAPLAHKLARHSDPKLTYGTYTSFELRKKAEAVLGLSTLPPEAA